MQAQASDNESNVDSESCSNEEISAAYANIFNFTYEIEADNHDHNAMQNSASSSSSSSSSNQTSNKRKKLVEVNAATLFHNEKIRLLELILTEQYKAQQRGKVDYSYRHHMDLIKSMQDIELNEEKLEQLRNNKISSSSINNEELNNKRQRTSSF